MPQRPKPHFWEAITEQHQRCKASDPPPIPPGLQDGPHPHGLRSRPAAPLLYGPARRNLRTVGAFFFRPFGGSQGGLFVCLVLFGLVWFGWFVVSCLICLFVCVSGRFAPSGGVACGLFQDWWKPVVRARGNASTRTQGEPRPHLDLTVSSHRASLNYRF